MTNRKNSVDILLKTKKANISTICSFFEPFEGLAAIRTPHPKPGEDAILHFMVSPDRKKEFEDLIKLLNKKGIILGKTAANP